jgi:mannose-6-phosphate isomerase
VASGVEQYDVPVADFSLRRAAADKGAVLPVAGASIVLSTGGEADVTGARSGGTVRLGPGEAVLVTPDEAEVRVSGSGEVFIAGPGVAEGAGAE